MNRGQLRDILERRLNAVVGVDWTEAELNLALDLGATDVKAAVVKWKATEGIRRWRVDIAVDPGTGRRDLYLNPGHGEMVVRMLDSSSSPARYRPIKYFNPEQLDVLLDTVGATPATSTDGYWWTIIGKNIQIVPEPTANVTLGLELQFVSSRVIFLNDAQDADAWGIELGLQMAIVYAAQIQLLGENQESLGDTPALYNDKIDKIPAFYPALHAEPLVAQMPHR